MTGTELAVGVAVILIAQWVMNNNTVAKITTVNEERIRALKDDIARLERKQDKYNNLQIRMARMEEWKEDMQRSIN